MGDTLTELVVPSNSVLPCTLGSVHHFMVMLVAQRSHGYQMLVLWLAYETLSSRKEKRAELPLSDMHGIREHGSSDKLTGRIVR